MKYDDNFGYLYISLKNGFVSTLHDNFIFVIFVVVVVCTTDDGLQDWGSLCSY